MPMRTFVPPMGPETYAQYPAGSQAGWIPAAAPRGYWTGPRGQPPHALPPPHHAMARVPYHPQEDHPHVHPLVGGIADHHGGGVSGIPVAGYGGPHYIDPRSTAAAVAGMHGPLRGGALDIVPTVYVPMPVNAMMQRNPSTIPSVVPGATAHEVTKKRSLHPPSK